MAKATSDPTGTTRAPPAVYHEHPTPDDVRVVSVFDGGGARHQETQDYCHNIYLYAITVECQEDPTLISRFFMFLSGDRRVTIGPKVPEDGRNIGTVSGEAACGRALGTKRPAQYGKEH